MSVIALSLTGFRRFADASLTLDETTILVGPNGAGKTTILEALYYLSLGRSYRTNHDRELITWTGDTFRLVGDFPDASVGAGGLTLERACSFLQGPTPTKRTRVNDVPRSFVDTLGLVRVVLFAPELIELVTGAPRSRRRYMDALLSSLNRAYAADLLAYQHALRQRNALLFAARPASDAAYEPWEAALVQYGTPILAARQRFVAFLEQYLPEAYASLVPAGSERAIQVGYAGTAPDIDQFTDLLASRRERDRALRATSVGPHRDDLLFTVDGRPAPAATSRGEQRTLLLALKQAEIAYLLTQPSVTSHQSSAGPILLLDDMFSELDRDRIDQLIRVVGAHQSVITTTDRTVIPASLASHGTIILVHEGLHVAASAR